MSKQKFGSVPVPNSGGPGYGPTFRSTMSNSGPQTYVLDGLTTIYETFRNAVANHGSRACLGRRAITPKGQVGGYVWWTYDEVQYKIDCFGTGLMEYGLLKPNAEGTKFFGILMPNNPHWIFSEQACFAYGGTTVPLYDTLGSESVGYVIRQTLLSTIVCYGKDVARLVELKDSCPTLEAVIYVGELPKDWKPPPRCPVRVLQFDDIEQKGQQMMKEGKQIPHRPPVSTDLATLCYTSGTTGDPKGAMLTHANMISNMAGLAAQDGPTHPWDIHISYLPLPHMYERVMLNHVLSNGSAAGFWRGDVTLILEDLVALQPTLFVSVPRLLNRLYDKITGGVKEAGGVKQALFEKAYNTKLQYLRQGHLTHKLWDGLVFTPLKTKLGLNRVREIITGSAPIAPHVMDFLRVVFGCNVIEGYGQTEATAAATCTLKGDFSHLNVGTPLPNNEVRLEDVAEMGYKSTDAQHGKGDTVEPCQGRGEICIRGPNVFKGYFKMPEKTAETIDKDGWLHTGDIGMWTIDGKLRIIDRKKNIFKLAQGEYVAPEKIENILVRSGLIAQAFVHGDSLQSQLVAVLVPDEETLMAWAKKKGLDGNFAQLCQREEVKAALLASAVEESKRGKLHGFETVRAVHLESSLWQPASDLLTPTFKLKRNVARQKYESEIANMYAALAKQPVAASKL
eukprot:TRINITY_DN62918_c0_g1_i1.p1 TRINITY_DN62918_c0_g1~~TRINITY_DN62918_c0_g1_i1.p1  ORF type:complete len:686 (+),score=60.63 TRINITY_DN62918_c0_g1_i1:23-2059(+)